jgi:3-hydroxyisobutyrate dehydrogenase-like beta-hydroxyacid dehydrogenase
MIKNLVQKGNLSKPLLLYNRTTKRATDLSSQLGNDKTTVIDNIPEIVKKSDIIFTCLGDDQAITETIDVAVKEDIKGKLFVDCSTVHPNTTDELEKKVTGSGAEFVAAPGERDDSYVFNHLIFMFTILSTFGSSLTPFPTSRINNPGFSSILT